MATATLSSSRSLNPTLPSDIFLVSGTTCSHRHLDQENKIGTAVFPSYSGQLLSKQGLTYVALCCPELP